MATSTIERFHRRHAVLKHGCWIEQTDLDIQGSHTHHAHTWSSCAWTTNGEVRGETVTNNNGKRCLHKWILISVAIEAAMLEDSMTSLETLYTKGVRKSIGPSWMNTKHVCYSLKIHSPRHIYTTLWKVLRRNISSLYLEMTYHDGKLWSQSRCATFNWKTNNLLLKASGRQFAKMKFSQKIQIILVYYWVIL